PLDEADAPLGEVVDLRGSAASRLGYASAGVASRLACASAGAVLLHRPSLPPPRSRARTPPQPLPGWGGGSRGVGFPGVGFPRKNRPGEVAVRNASVTVDRS